MDRIVKSACLEISILLLVTSLLASAIHTTALVSDDSSPPAEDINAGDDSDSPSLEDIDTSKYIEADLEDIGTYDLQWTDSTPSERQSERCRQTGYYDPTVLTNETLVRSCFAELADIINTGAADGAQFLTDTFYYPTDANPYCAVICREGSTGFALSSVDMSFVSLAFAFVAFLAVNYF